MSKYDYEYEDFNNYDDPGDADDWEVMTIKFSKTGENTVNSHPKPFVKWVGGKRQLIPDVLANLPDGLGERYTKYVEPFVGGGAVLFELLNRYNFEQVIINDLNDGLINAYRTVQDNADELISELELLQNQYYELDGLDQKQDLYYEIREKYNGLLQNANLIGELSIQFAAYFIFLNKTCFNGMYRVNKKGLYNVPFGKSEKPTICDSANLITCSKALQHVTILQGDYRQVDEFVDNKTLVYFDPPYRPITKTAAFTSYTSDGFDDFNQIDLSKFAHKLSQRGAKIILSNSDSKNALETINFQDYHHDFFDNYLYNWAFVRRVKASRAINSNGQKRGNINEILVTNYRKEQAYA